MWEKPLPSLRIKPNVLPDERVNTCLRRTVAFPKNSILCGTIAGY